MGGGIDDHRDFGRSLMLVPYCQKLAGDGGRLVAVSRAQRLLDLIQVLRRHRQPVSGAALAEATGVSLRTLYRDIATLQAEGAHIDGEAGVGYVLRPGFMLPPLMFSEEEIEALVLGSRWVHQRADRALADAAATCWPRSAPCCPTICARRSDDSGLLVGAGRADRRGRCAAAQDPPGHPHRAQARRFAIATRTARPAERTIWPFALGFFDRVRVVVAWCELRQDFRHFRTDRIATLTHRQALSAPPPGHAQGMARARGHEGSLKAADRI